MNELLAKLAEPFEPSAITWKPGATKDNKCLALTYADLRSYQERLDAVCGLDWSCKYTPWGDGRIICELTINGVTRSSTGEMDSQEEKGGNGGTVAEAQAMKRAAAQFGLGRYLYELPNAWVDFDPQRKRITEAGQAQLERTYKAWYAKAMAATSQDVTQPSPKISKIDNPVDGDVLFAKVEPPTDEEHDILSMWSSYQDARSWAIMVGACENEFEAKNSMEKVIRNSGLEVNKANKPVILLLFLRHQQEKLQQPQPA